VCDVVPVLEEPLRFEVDILEDSRKTAHNDEWPALPGCLAPVAHLV